MKKEIVVIAGVILGTNLAHAQEDLSVIERAEILTELVNSEGIVAAVASSDMSETEVRMLDMILDLELPGSDEARDLLEYQIDGMLPEPNPDFVITHSRKLMQEATEMWGGAMHLMDRGRRMAIPETRPTTPEIQIPLKTQPLSLPLAIPFAIPSIVKAPPTKIIRNLSNIRYSVWVENQTEITVSEMIVFYLQRGSSVMQMRQIIPVLPGGIAMFELGQCSVMESYSLGIFVGDDMVARVPEPGQSMTPELATQYHPWDNDPCKDTWGFGR